MIKQKGQKNTGQKTLVVIGLGYVGLPLALLASKKGWRTFGVDADVYKVSKLMSKQSPFADKRVEEDLKNSSLTPTTDFSVVKQADVVVICVPTPVHENYMPDLAPVENACKSIAPHIQVGQLIILESTVNPGVSEDVVLPLLERLSELKAGEDFYLAHCPERINPGDKKWDVENIPRVVGSLEEKGLEKAVSFYSSIITGKVKSMASLKEAEAVKVVENSFRDINIAFVNELAMSFSKLGIDVVNVIEGAATKPFAFMPHFPGCGVGGHCIPVDPYYLIEYAKGKGFDHDFLVLARRINKGMPAFTIDLLVRALNEKSLAIKGTKISVLGLAYKGDIDDCRESPSFEIIKLLEEKGADVDVYDPYVLGKSTVQTLGDALDGAQAVIIATPHSEFKKVTPYDLKKHGVSVVIDGRNCLDKKLFLLSGVLYVGIGR